MKFVSVRDLRGKSKEIWKKLSVEKEMVITSNGRPIAVLSGVTESGLESYLAALRRAKAIQAAQEIQSISVKSGKGGMSPREIQAEITVVRKRRPR